MIKIKRTQPEPPELAKARYSDNYNIPAVREQLRKDFHNKCYLCGTPTVDGFEIEHLLPHHGGEDKARKSDWDNLFMSCSNCNGIKKDHYDDQLIDCCREDPEKLICHRIDRGRITVSARKTAPDQLRAEKTAELIEKCFNYSKDSQSAENCTQKRRELKLRAIDLCKKLRRYRELRDRTEDRDEPALAEAENDVLDLIDITSEYAGFLRTIVRDRLVMFPEFEEVVGADPEKGVHKE